MIFGNKKEGFNLMSILKKIKCPLIGNPHEDCYCYELNSRTIERTLYYCNENFIECRIYKKKLNESLSSKWRGKK